jgi:hypothetical protein
VPGAVAPLTPFDGLPGGTPPARPMPSIPTDQLVGASKTSAEPDLSEYATDAAKSFGIGLAKSGIGLVGTPATSGRT